MPLAIPRFNGVRGTDKIVGGLFSKTSKRATFTGFFNRDAVINRLNKKEYKVLARTGAYARRTARNMMKAGGFGSKERNSLPGEPPRYHNRNLKDLIFYALADDKNSVVIGPISFKSDAQLLRGVRSGAQVLEEGGLLYFPRRQRVGYIEPRPYMAPTMEVAKRQFIKVMKEVKL